MPPKAQTMKLMWPTKPADVEAAVKAELERLQYVGKELKILKETTLPNGRFRVELG